MTRADLAEALKEINVPVDIADAVARPLADHSEPVVRAFLRTLKNESAVSAARAEGVHRNSIYYLKKRLRSLCR